MIIPKAVGGAPEGYDWREAAHDIQRRDPALYRSLNPRDYWQATEWEPFELVATGLAGIALSLRSDAPSNLTFPEKYDMSHVEPTVRSLIAHRVPTFFVTAPIAQAIWETVPPLTLDYMTMKLPFESGVFMLPRHALEHERVGYCPFIIYSRLRDRFVIIGAQHLRAPLLHTYMFWPDRVGQNIDLRNLNGAMLGLHDDSLHPPGYDDADRLFTEAFVHYTFGLLMLMNSRPDYIEAGRKKAVSIRKGTQLWSPNLIGKSYQVKRSPNFAEPGSSIIPKRAHWRRGHWRDQAYGPAFSLRKYIWMEPMLVMGAGT